MRSLQYMDSNSRLARGQARAALPTPSAGGPAHPHTSARGRALVGGSRGEALMDWWIAAILHQSGRRPSSVYSSLFLESMMFSLRIS